MLRTISRALLSILFIFSTLLLVGCSDVPVAEELTQEQAREVVAALSKRGISSTFERKRKGVGKFSVSVSSRQFSEAVQILHEEGVPESARGDILDSLSSHSFLPDSQMVESLRLDYAKALQLEELLENLPGVVSARAVVRLHSAEQGEEGEEANGKGASVVLRVSDTGAPQKEELESLIRSAIPGLGDKDVHIAQFQVASKEGLSSASDKDSSSPVEMEEFLFGWQVAKQDYNGLTLSLLGTVLLFLVAGGLAGYWFGYMSSFGRSAERNAGSAPFDVGDFPVEREDYTEVNL